MSFCVAREQNQLTNGGQRLFSNIRRVLGGRQKSLFLLSGSPLQYMSKQGQVTSPQFSIQNKVRKVLFHHRTCGYQRDPLIKSHVRWRNTSEPGLVTLLRCSRKHMITQEGSRAEDLQTILWPQGLICICLSSSPVCTRTSALWVEQLYVF